MPDPTKPTDTDRDAHQDDATNQGVSSPEPAEGDAADPAGDGGSPERK